MGRIQCPIHGHQGIAEICTHLWKGFQNQTFQKTRKIPVLGTWVCENCFTKNKAQELEGIKLEDIFKMSKDQQDQLEKEISLQYEHINKKIECIECLNTFRLNAAKKNGEQFPFEPFENTLMYKDNEKIETLKKMLLSNFKFQKSKIPYFNHFDSVFLKSGGISYPFSITFYYVINKEDQIKLLKLIDDFFEQIPQKQRKISFYESENWIIEKTANSTTESKGKEKLLLEKIIK